MFTKLLFNLICVIHCLVWIFVLFAFLNRKLAYINIFYIIPLIYIIHIFPFHIITKSKENLYPDSWEEKYNNFLESSPLGILKVYVDTQEKLDNYCFGNPIGPQGMLILGLITSAYSLKLGKALIMNKIV